MKVFLCFCACLAASKAGIIGYPVALPSPVGYQSNVVLTHPVTTFARPFGLGYPGIHGYPIAVPPSYFSYNIIPGSVIFPGVPGVHYFPVAPPMGKEKPGKKKPGNKKDDKDTKEETTEASKPEESETKSGEEAEDLSD